MVCILNTIFGNLTAFSPTYWSYFTFRFLTGCSTGGVGLCAFVLATEPVGPSMRGAAGMSTFYFFSSGIAFLSGIAYIFPTWRQLYIASSIPSLLFLLFVLPFISESPRWYLVRGRIKEAMNVMKTIATSNGNHLPRRVLLTLDEQSSSSSSLSLLSQSLSSYDNTEDKDALTSSLVDVIRSPVTRVRLILAISNNHQLVMLGCVLRSKLERGKLRNKSLPECYTQRGGGDAGIHDNSDIVG